MSSPGRINVLSSDVFNSNKEELSWRNLTNERRVELLKIFFQGFNHPGTEKTIDNNTVEMITDMAIKGKLKLKKEISYDRVNKRIIKVNALVPREHTDHYVYKPELLIKKENSSKVAKNLLFRKS
jgi:hypothetical protein